MFGYDVLKMKVQRR